MKKGLISKLLFFHWCFLAVILFVIPTPSMAKNSHKHSKKLPDWCVVEPKFEIGSEEYDSMPYSKIAPRLCEIQRTSDRVSVEVIGQSDGGRNLFLVTITNPMDKKRKKHKMLPKNEKAKHFDRQNLHSD